MFANWLEDSWNNLNDIPHIWYYIGGAGGGLVLLAVLMCILPRVRIPGIVLSIVGGVGIGLAAGILLMGLMGYTAKKPEEGGGDNQAAAGGRGGRGGNMPAPGGGGGFGGGAPGGFGGGAPGGFGAGGGRGGNTGMNKFQLTALVNKLDQMTEKPLEIKLTDKEKNEIREQLAGLGDLEELSDDAAKEKSEKLHELLKDQKDTMEKAGYRWPGQGGGGPFGGGPGGGRRGGGGQQEPPKNPFKEKPNAEHLKELTERLGKKQA
jgi:hypothetical protein